MLYDGPVYTYLLLYSVFVLSYLYWFFIFYFGLNQPNYYTLPDKMVIFLIYICCFGKFEKTLNCWTEHP